MIYTHAAAAMAGAAFAAVAAWNVQGWRIDAQLQTLKTEYATAQAQAMEKAHAETVRLQTQADKAAKQHAARAAALANDARRSSDALGLLHDAANAAITAAQDSHAFCQRVAATSTELLQQCSSEYRSVAAEADGWVNHALMLRESWPTSPKP